MAGNLEVPKELQELLEKRELEDRRNKQDQPTGPPSSVSERRKGERRKEEEK